MNQSQRALSGIRVLDLSRVLAGPFCGQILGDLGADVIKVERAGVGDDGRKYGFGALKDADGNRTLDSSFFFACNRNKRSLTVDLSKPAGQELIRSLAAKSDVLIENYKVGDLKRYGLDYESLSKINPRLIYCSVTGYGQSGPQASRPGYDGLFQAMGGMMAVTGIPDGQPGAGPLKAGPSIVDVFTGHNAALAVLAALNQRHATGKGQYIDIALLDCAVAMVSHIAQDYLISGIVPPRLGNGGNGGGPSDLLQCKDGTIYITAGTQDHWVRLCGLMQRPELIEDPRFITNPLRGANRNDLIDLINEWSCNWSTTDLLAALDNIAIPAARYNDLPDVFRDDQVIYRGLKATVQHPQSGDVHVLGSPLAHMSGSPMQYESPPGLGQHTDSILSDELGLSADRIAELRAQGII